MYFEACAINGASISAKVIDSIKVDLSSHMEQVNSKLSLLEESISSKVQSLSNDTNDKISCMREQHTKSTLCSKKGDLEDPKSMGEEKEEEDILWS